MAISKGLSFVGRDVYVDYSYMRVMFRWDHVAQKIFVRFYGKVEAAVPVPHDNELFNEAILYGSEIPQEEYLRGK
jgi:hypothetical protein